MSLKMTALGMLTKIQIDFEKNYLVKILRKFFIFIQSFVNTVMVFLLMATRKLKILFQG